MSKVIVAVQARMGSTRLPNKPAIELGGKPEFVTVFERCKEYLPNADGYFFTTTNEMQDDALVLLAKTYGYEVFRGAIQLAYRTKEFIDNYLGLKDEDIWFSPHCDAPLAFFGHVPYMIQKLIELGLDHIIISEPNNTLGRAVGLQSYAITTVGAQRSQLNMALANTAVEGSAAFWPLPVFNYLILKLPPELYLPWPWGSLFLDYPIQAIQLREIYRVLYQDKPIKISAIYELFQTRPYFANLNQGLPVTQNVAYQQGNLNLDFQEIKQTCHFIELEWEGNENEDIKALREISEKLKKKELTK